MLIQFLIVFTFALTGNASVVKVPAGKTPTPTPCVETGVKGEEKCVVPLAPAANAEPKFELPTETPRAKKK